MTLHPYEHRLQTKTKHFILKRYLQTLSFKVLSFLDELAYVDGFSGPWKSQTEDFSDTSFMIALGVLKDVQRQMAARGRFVRIKCFFVEADAAACANLKCTVAEFHKPGDGFEVIVRCCKFEDSIAEIESFVGRAFALTFIDPTGWTGYSYEKIKPILVHQPGEVVINFMFDHVNRFREHPDDKIITSMDDIFGGPGWSAKLDRQKPGPSLVELFRVALGAAGNFKYVLATPIEKSTEDRPHFYLVYGTRSDKGLEAFRGVEFDALKGHEADRKVAKAGKREAVTGIRDLFADVLATDETSLSDEVEHEKMVARSWVVEHLKANEITTFRKLWPVVLDRFRLRTTDVKKIVTSLGEEGLVADTWSIGRRRVPHDDDIIKLVTSGTAK